MKNVMATLCTWTTLAPSGTRTRRTMGAGGWMAVYVVTATGHSFDYTECAECGSVLEATGSHRPSCVMNRPQVRS